MVYNITFIGAGNVAWHLAQALENAGHHIEAVYSPSQTSAEALTARLYDAYPTNSLDFSQSRATVFIIAVTDDATAEIADQLILPEEAIMCHTSGTVPLAVFADRPHVGVFYPLQTFSKSKKLDILKVPLCLEASSNLAEQVLVDLGQSISNTVYLISSQERKILHIAAVFACNFTNHLLALSKQIVDNEELEFELLRPLIEETLTKALQAQDPAQVQTGPAIRNDVETISRHLDYLEDYPDKHQIYKILTDSIRNNRRQD